MPGAYRRVLETDSSIKNEGVLEDTVYGTEAAQSFGEGERTGNS